MRRVLAALALLASSFAVTSPASASSCEGVQVVVDFTALGGGVETGCAAGDPASGLAALTDAGFTYSFVPRRPGLVCTIKSLPNPCKMPTTSAYWSYWHATPGGAWTYSSVGAGSYDPAPGTVEGWSYGTGVAPGATP
ncbi:hypothetical protein UK23_05705 [Lentzea aerocolonigenes]|uniref:Flagellar hook-length control protein FliK n=1 Tax=Lentzea aerocolonigenes TaxID=68170 RepID=A0A0F0HBU9_LENAE|nr:hypothetical protein [Lentzea aerocolonigenes]KJK51817.1 hypothetical protein UK23_05705 [Lentzea aerocolonigenes]